MVPHIRSYRAPFSCFPRKVSLQLSSEQSVGNVRREFHRRGPTAEKFCHNNCWVFAAPHKWKRQLTAESAECCRTRDGCRRPSREATGEPGMPVWTWHALRWVASGVGVIPARYDHCIVCQWSVVQWHSAQTAACAVECPAARRAANCSNPTGGRK